MDKIGYVVRSVSYPRCYLSGDSGNGPLFDTLVGARVFDTRSEAQGANIELAAAGLDFVVEPRVVPNLPTDYRQETLTTDPDFVRTPEKEKHRAHAANSRK